jgi:hypothetical protein
LSQQRLTFRDAETGLPEIAGCIDRQRDPKSIRKVRNRSVELAAGATPTIVIS